MDRKGGVIGCGSSVGRLSASYASGPEIDPCVRHIFSWKIFPLHLIQEEQVVSYWRMNGHMILVNWLWEACPGSVIVTDCPNIASAVHPGRKATNQTNKQTRRCCLPLSDCSPWRVYTRLFIRITSPCDLYPLTPHFDIYSVKKVMDNDI